MTGSSLSAEDNSREIENLTHILFYLKFSGQKVKGRTERRGIQGRNLVILRGEAQLFTIGRII